jgi:DNA-binding NarL/FixJ family response regulator
MATARPIRVLLADDQDCFRSALRALLSLQPDIQVLEQEARDGTTAVQLASTLSPDVTLMDLGMPGVDGIAATRQLTTADPSKRVLALSGSADAASIRAALGAGAAGFVLKLDVHDDLPAAVRTVMGNEPFISPSLRHLV